MNSPGLYWLAIIGVAILLVCLLVITLIGVLQRRVLMKENARQREARGLREKQPFFRREVVEEKVRKLFPNSFAQIMQRLDDEVANWELERTQLAILKLSDGDLSALDYYLGRAMSDYVEVIGLAEYPAAQEMGYDYAKLSNPDQEKVHRKDLNQYLRWLKGT